ncbi:hypothetical protein CHUAL_011651 [Chamberlinius hualienensis]
MFGKSLFCCLLFLTVIGQSYSANLNIFGPPEYCENRPCYSRPASCHAGTNCGINGRCCYVPYMRQGCCIPIH